MSSHSCLAKEFQWGCVEFFLKASTPKLLFNEVNWGILPNRMESKWSHDKSMCEVFTFLGVCDVVRVYGWSLGKGQNILAKGLKIDFWGHYAKFWSKIVSILHTFCPFQRSYFTSEKKVSWEPHSACIICSELPCTMAYRAAISTCFTALC